VWDVGMTHSDWRLCARYPDPNPLDLYLVARNTVPVRMWLYRIVPGQLPVHVLDATPTPGMNFPWGEDVVPD